MLKFQGHKKAILIAVWSGVVHNKEIIYLHDVICLADYDYI